MATMPGARVGGGGSKTAGEEKGEGTEVRVGRRESTGEKGGCGEGRKGRAGSWGGNRERTRRSRSGESRSKESVLLRVQGAQGFSNY